MLWVYGLLAAAPSTSNGHRGVGAGSKRYLAPAPVLAKQRTPETGSHPSYHFIQETTAVSWKESSDHSRPWCTAACFCKFPTDAAMRIIRGRVVSQCLRPPILQVETVLWVGRMHQPLLSYSAHVPQANRGPDIKETIPPPSPITQFLGYTSPGLVLK